MSNAGDPAVIINMSPLFSCRRLDVTRCSRGVRLGTLDIPVDMRWSLGRKIMGLVWTWLDVRCLEISNSSRCFFLEISALTLTKFCTGLMDTHCTARDYRRTGSHRVHLHNPTFHFVCEGSRWRLEHDLKSHKKECPGFNDTEMNHEQYCNISLLPAFPMRNKPHIPTFAFVLLHPLCP